MKPYGKNSKILVLGGHGFVGKSLVKAFNNTQHEVIVLSRRSGLDLRHYPAVKQALKDIQPDVIYNCAAHVGGLHYVSDHPASVLADNLQMTINLYQAIQESSPFTLIINPLSNCSYPGDAEIYSEQDWLAGEVHQSVFSYGNAKRTVYAISRCYSLQFGIKTINFLVPNSFGPGDSTAPHLVHAINGMIIRMLQAQMKGHAEFEIWGTGKPIQEWIYVADVAEILKIALSLDLDLIYPVNIAQQQGYSIQESAELIAKAVNFKGKLVFQSEYQDGAPKKILDARRFRTIFPDYKFTDPYSGICNTVDYYRSILGISKIRNLKFVYMTK